MFRTLTLFLVGCAVGMGLVVQFPAQVLPGYATQARRMALLAEENERLHLLAQAAEKERALAENTRLRAEVERQVVEIRGLEFKQAGGLQRPEPRADQGDDFR